MCWLLQIVLEKKDFKRVVELHSRCLPVVQIQSCWFCHLATFEGSLSWWGTISRGQIKHISVHSIAFIATFWSCVYTKQPWELTLRASPACRNFRFMLVREEKAVFNLTFFFTVCFLAKAWVFSLKYVGSWGSVHLLIY